MTSVLIFLCVLGCLLFLAFTTIFKGIDALVDTLLEMVDVFWLIVFAILLCLGLKFLAMLFGGAMTWGIFFQTALIVIALLFLIGLGATILEYVNIVVVFVSDLLLTVVHFIGEKSESLLKTLIGKINKMIPLS